MLGFSEVGEVLVVGEYLNREMGALEVMVPTLQPSKYCKEFSVIDVVVLFCRGE